MANCNVPPFTVIDDKAVFVSAPVICWVPVPVLTNAPGPIIPARWDLLVLSPPIVSAAPLAMLTAPPVVPPPDNDPIAELYATAIVAAAALAAFATTKGIAVAVTPVVPAPEMPSANVPPVMDTAPVPLIVPFDMPK